MTTMDILQSNLASEQLLWSEKPTATASFRGQNIFGFIFGMVFTTFSVAALNHPPKNNSDDDIMVFMMIFFGIFSTVYAFLDVFKAWFSLYGITAKRLIIVRKYPWASEIESFYREDIGFIKKTVNATGRGSIIFKTIQEKSGRSYRSINIGFFGIRDVNMVEKLIIQTFREGH